MWRNIWSYTHLTRERATSFEWLKHSEAQVLTESDRVASENEIKAAKPDNVLLKYIL